MGGEKPTRRLHTYGKQGSPPRGRGKDNIKTSFLCGAWITPAWAGKSTMPKAQRWAYGDHPRVGGEKSRRSRSSTTTRGSPPRGRGKDMDEVADCTHVRITPAWAGKRRWWQSTDLWRGDHPRVGGEKLCFFQGDIGLKGSPPRGRGKAFRQTEAPSRKRITPAWAGKRYCCPTAASRSGDHPRVGGEKQRAAIRLPERLGSPPRGRGKAQFQLRPFGFQGITPAWAGKRLKRSHRSGIFISGPIPFHSVLHRPAGSGGSRAGRDGSPAGQPQNAGPA